MTQPPSEPPPIIPGQPHIEVLPAAPPPPKKRATARVVAALVVAVTFLVAGSFYIVDRVRGSGADVPLIASKTELRKAHETCRQAGVISDNDHTLYLDMVGDDVGSGDFTLTDVRCVLGALGTPQSVIHEMDSTRALDGRQSDTWGDFKVSWTYHPDEGLDILITES